MTEGRTKIAVCVPWDTPFMWSAPAFNMLNWERPENADMRFFNGSGWCPAARHNQAVEKALSWGADLVMFNGPDHLCPFDIIPRMVNRLKEGWDMVHAMPPSRGVVGVDGTPFKALSYKITGPIPKERAVMGGIQPSSIKVLSYDDEPQSSHICGTGNVLMKSEIFDGLEKPYFEEEIKKDGKYSRYPVMDSTFIHRCTVESGARMFCDTSIRIAHLDVFAIDDTFTDRWKDKQGDFDWCPAKDISKYV